MDLLARYQQDLTQNRISVDEKQAHVIHLLNDIIQQLAVQHASLQRRLAYFLPLSLAPIRGLYMWGGVGRGKTYVMDLFFEAVPFAQKKRLHFHHFMMQVHEQLKTYQGKDEPLKIIAKRWRKDFRVLCFDEFFVSDIADAMILANIFRYLFDNGITLIATSNIEPRRLYHNGLQRDKFLPTIDLILKHTQVVELDNGIDYRLRYLTKAKIYHYPVDNQTESKLTETFEQLAPNPGRENAVITIHERPIKCIKEADSIIWFDFKEICQTPRSQYDYIDIAKIYHTVLISCVSQMDQALDDVARRFIMLIDEFYDQQVTLILSSSVSIDELYAGDLLSFEFQRTISRLHEMGTLEYLAKPHLA